jgi:hypothetical protein
VAAISWKTGVSGSWTTAANWNPATVPISSSDVTIGASGTYTVTLSTATSIDSLDVGNASAELDIENSSGTVAIADGVTSGGLIDIDTASGAGGSGFTTPTVTIGGALSQFASGHLQIGPSDGSLSDTVIVDANSLSGSGPVAIYGTPGSNFLAKLGITANAPATLDSVVTLSGDALLEFGGGAIDSIGTAGNLTLSSAFARVSVPTNTIGNSALNSLSSMAGKLTLGDGAALTVTGDLDDTGAISIDTGSFYGGSNFSVEGTLTVSAAGTLQIGASNDGLQLDTTASVGALSNAGTIKIYGGAPPNTVFLPPAAVATLAVNGPAPATLNGTFDFYDAAALTFTTGSVQNLGTNANILFDGASGDSLSGLVDNAGVLNFEDSDFQDFNATFTNTDQLLVDTGVGGSGSSVEFENAFVNDGVVDVGPSSGAPTTNSTVDLEGPITGTGSFTVSNGATLFLSDTVGSGQTINIADGNLEIAPSGFSGTIAGFGVGDSIELGNVAYSASDYVTFVGNGSFTGGTVSVDNSSGTTIASFKVSGNYEPSQFLLSDDNGEVALVGAVGLPKQVASDFTGNGLSDILWSNTNSDTAIWYSNGAGGFTPQDLGVVAGSQIAGTGDFKGNGLADIVWSNTTTGDTSIWYSNGAGGFTPQDLGVVSTNWQIAGTGDFDGNGLGAILWRNTNGDTAIWQSNGSGGFTNQDLGVISTNWQIAGTGDFNGDGRTDILWSNTNGDTSIWYSNGSGGFTPQDLGVVAGSQIAGTGDFNGNGLADILWRNSTTGDTTIWDSNGSGGFTSEDLGIVSTNWKIAGVGDFNSNGLADILWRNTSTGDTTIWDSNGSGGFTAHDLGIVSTSWTIKGA